MGRQIHYDIARDILDKQLHDVNGVPFGKVDGVVIVMPRGGQPRIDRLEIGGVTAVRRLPRVVRWILEPLARRWGAQRGAPMRIAWSKVTNIGIDVDVDIDAEDSPALYWSRRARKIIARIPGSAA